MKLWFFRTPGGVYMAAKYKPRPGNFALLDSGYIQGCEMIFARKPRGLPKLAKGACVPVTLRVEE